jgi:IS30 family transposase
MTQKEIASVLCCHKSTISRELKRNCPQRGRTAGIYDPIKAQQRTEQRHRSKAKRIQFNAFIKEKIVHWLKFERLSPELIAVKGKKIYGSFISHESIYRWIWQMKHSHCRDNQPYKYLFHYLRHGRRRRKRSNQYQNRGCIPHRVSIEQRPAVVNKKQRLGDFEIDLMMGKNHRPGLLVMMDRTTLKTYLAKINTKASLMIAKTIIHKLQACRSWIKTITYDNDLAFSAHTMVNSSLNTKSFFTHPYTSQEKGSVENRIGLLRRFFPKQTDFDQISHQYIKHIENLINQRPVKKFNFLTPNDLFLQKCPVALIT